MSGLAAYVDPKLGFISRKALKCKVPDADVRALEHVDLVQMNRRPVKPKTYLKITGPPRAFQTDMVNFSDFPKQNKGFVKALLIIEILSRKAFVYMQKSFKMAETIENYKNFLAEMDNKVISVAGDNDFSNKEFLKLNKERGITVFHDVAADDHITRHGKKLGILAPSRTDCACTWMSTARGTVTRCLTSSRTTTTPCMQASKSTLPIRCSSQMK